MKAIAYGKHANRVAISLLVCLALLTIAAGCAPTPSTETTMPPETELEARIEVPATLSSGEAVNLRFTLINNAATALHVLKWYTPLEGIAGEIFRVERDGQVLPYQGMLAKRAAPLPVDYVLLEPGKSVSAQVDLATAYDFSQAGQYSIEFLSPSISHVARREAEMAKTVDDLHPVSIPSNGVTTKIGGSSGETGGQSVVPVSIDCRVSYRPSVTETLSESGITLTTNGDQGTIEFNDMEFNAKYWDDEFEGRSLLISVINPDTGNELVRQLYQMDRGKTPINQFIGGHGFTGLIYVYHPSSTAELQCFCKAS